MSELKPMPTRLKKRYSILLSDELAERFERVARRRNGAKSAIIEEMLDRRLNPERYPLIDDGILRRLDELSKDFADIKRDLAIVTEMVSLFVRYYLTITPPLATGEQQPARRLGKERFEVFVAQIGRRLASDRRLVSDVLESIAVHNPDLFATASDDAPLKANAANSAQRPTVVNLKTNGQTPAETPTRAPTKGSSEKRNG
jgi:predicted DNA-binding protein